MSTITSECLNKVHLFQITIRDFDSFIYFANENKIVLLRFLCFNSSFEHKRWPFLEDTLVAEIGRVKKYTRTDF